MGVYSEENLAGSLSKGKVALLASDGSQVTSLNVGYKQNYDFAPTTQYREYEDGSVYYKGEETFANEHLKVIGKTYDGKEYTGELKKSTDGVAIVGRQAAFSSVPIPQNTKPHGNLDAGRRGPKDRRSMQRRGRFQIRLRLQRAIRTFPRWTQPRTTGRLQMVRRTVKSATGRISSTAIGWRIGRGSLTISSGQVIRR